MAKSTSTVPKRKRTAARSAPASPPKDPVRPPPTPTRIDAGWPPVSYWMKVTAGIIVVIVLARAFAAVQNVIVLLVISLVLAIGFQPIVAWLERHGVKRGWAVAIIFGAGLLVVTAFLVVVLPSIIREIGNLVREAPRYLEEAQEGSGFIGRLNAQFDLEEKLRSLQADLPGTALSLVTSFAAFVFNTVTVVILTLYFTMSMPRLRSGISRLLFHEDRADFEEIIEESTQRVGGYVIGNLAVSAIAGVLSFVVLLLLGIPFAAALAFWVALTDLIPTIGALLGAAAAGIVAAFTGVPQLIGVLIFFLVYQQVENYLITPRVMKRAIDMSAALVIVAVLIGGSLAGVVGALLALPIAAIVKVALRELYIEDRLESIQAAEQKKR